MCGGSLLNILIEEHQTPFGTEDSLTDCTLYMKLVLFVLYLCYELNH